jgi:hypothetical protein
MVTMSGGAMTLPMDVPLLKILVIAEIVVFETLLRPGGHAFGGGHGGVRLERAPQQAHAAETGIVEFSAALRTEIHG